MPPRREAQHAGPHKDVRHPGTFDAPLPHTLGKVGCTRGDPFRRGDKVEGDPLGKQRGDEGWVRAQLRQSSPTAFGVT